ncbi:hypothetical protein ACLPHM_05785 [Paenalcaligenes sp. Me131]|uniref:hypothetical protein n=1 Tax=Paenalcaligenes sp. Me131 TaxID=3392636 RepID=UPI003D2E002E
MADKKTKIENSTKLIIYLILWYFYAYLFYVGYFDYFNIPISLLNIDLSDLIPLGISLAFIGPLFCFFLITLAKDYLKFLNKKSPYISYCIVILFIPLLFIHLTNYARPYLLIWSFVEALLIFIPILALEKNKTKTEEKTKIEKTLSDIYLSVVLLAIVSPTLGYIYASNKTLNTAVNGYTIIKTNGFTAIAKKDPKNKKEYIRIINLEDKHIKTIKNKTTN